jgi:YD repeat-containing protein
VDTAGVVYTPGSITGFDGGPISSLITDIDGNKIQTNATGWTDSVNRTIPGSATNPGLPYPTPGAGLGYSEDLVPGVETAPSNTPCPAGSKDARVWTVPVPGNTTANYYLCYADFSYFSNFNLDAIYGNTFFQNVSEAAPQTARLLTAIILPNSTSYTFSYDNYLSLTQLTLPSGGSIAYTWQVIPFVDPTPTGSGWPTSPVSRALSTRTVYPGNGEPPQVWSYHWYFGTSPGTVSYNQPNWSVVTDPYGNDTEHQLGGTDYNGNSPNALVETASAVYTGCSPHDTASNRTCSTTAPLLMQSTAYGLTGSVSGGAQVGSPSFFATYFPSWKTTTTVTTIPSSVGNLVTKTVTGLVPNHGTCTVQSLGIMQAGYGANPPPSTTIIPNCFAYAQPQSVATYDYGVGTPGPLHSTMTTTYAWNSAAGYLAANLLDLTSTQTITDAASSPASETDYSYDEMNFSPTGLHGDLTSLTRVNQEGASQKMHAYYNNNGEMTGTVDGNGGTTSITAFQCSGSLPQTISNALGQTSQYTFDCGTGVLTQFQSANDFANGRSGSTFSYDTVRNPTLVTHPDGGSMSINYNSYSIPLTVTKTVLASPNPSVVSGTVYDGFLRPVQLALPNGATSETTYDLLGRVMAVTNPHFGNADGITTSLFDTLGRLVKRVNSDFTSLWYCFNGVRTNQQPNCHGSPSGVVGTWVDGADESGNNTQQLSDAEGDLLQIVEPGSLTTSYSYNVLKNLHVVNQIGIPSSEVARVRTFTYDSLSRLICAANPENSIASCPASGLSPLPSGVMQYSYDPNGNLQQTIDAKNLVTSYKYDALNRMIRKTVPLLSSTGVIQNQYQSTCYQYDSMSGASASRNLVGELVAEWTQKGNICTSTYTPSVVLTANVVLGYDAMGRPLQSQQCVLSMCQANSFTQNQTYDLAGNMTSWTDGRGYMNFGQEFDAAGKPVSVTNSVFGNGLPFVLFSAGGYTPAGALQGWNLGDYMDFGRNYDNRLRISSGAVSHFSLQ